MSLLDSLAAYRPTMTEAAGEYDGAFSTYPELHASMFAVGYALLFYLALILWTPATLLVGIQIIRALYYAYTGQRIDLGGHRLGLPDKYLMQIHEEPHYFSVPLAVLLVGGGAGLEMIGFDVIERIQNLA